jgi:hypothetical protein
MVPKSGRVRVLAILFSLIIAVATGPFPLAETVSVIPLGTLVTAGNATVGNIAAPTGTTIFTGDMVTSAQPALINFASGSRIEMTKASANFAREGKTLVVQASQGLLRFNFLAGEQVQFDAGAYRFTTLGNSSHVGELGLNRGGQVVMTVAEGTLAAVNNATGAKTEVNPNNPLIATTPSGQAAGQAATDISVDEESSSTGITAGVVAGVVSSVGFGVGVHEATKSTSSR